MCRLLGYCSHENVSVSELLGEPGLAAFTALSCAHSDGWGMAALDGDQVRVARSPQQAGEDDEYHRLAKERLGDTGLVHLRWATPGLPVEMRNCHPFRYGEFTMAHNGAIHPQDRLPEMLPPEWERRLTGSTDSERYFLHLMSRLEARDGDVVAAAADTVAHIRRHYTPNSLNAILLGPDALYAISWHDPERIPYALIKERETAGAGSDPAAYFHLAWRQDADSVVVSSTGWPQDGWNILPNGAALTVSRSGRSTRVELF